MTERLPRRAATVAAMAALVLLVPAPAPAQQSILVPFEIKDQFDRVHRHSDYAEQILIVIGSDRNGSEFHDDWESALRDSLAADSSDAGVAFLSVAEVRGVPFFLKGSVKVKFSREEDEWILLDWKGLLAETYGFEANSANILVFAADGTLALHVHGRELDLSKLSVLLATLRQTRADTPN